ncbi:MAG: helix-turn-helix transcriptional regulator [Candidatus Sulfotelmatobacter sp.]
MKNNRDLRLELGWSQWQLAEASGVERTRISHIENDHIHPRAEEQAAIRRALLEETARKKELLSSVEVLEVTR